MSRFTIAKYTDGKYRWKLVNYTHVYHLSEGYKTFKTCEKGINNFLEVFYMATNIEDWNAEDIKVYICKEVQKL